LHTYLRSSRQWLGLPAFLDGHFSHHDGVHTQRRGDFSFFHLHQVMAGHNKWSKVKRLKGALDAKRGKLFSKLAKEITLAAKTGGGSPNGNPRLRTAVHAARTASMPNDNIERAIKRGTGEGSDAVAIEELTYEAYGPGGVALLIEAATDNKNRTAQDLRTIFTRHGGNLATSGAVLFQFKHKGQITIPKVAAPEGRVLEVALAAGADDVAGDDEHHLILTSHDQLYAVGDSLKRAGLEPDSMKLTYLPENIVPVTDEIAAAQFLRLSDALEDNDDVQNVHANADIPEELLVKIGG
jgi:YebC/PmpR family DNA-binding regulatory protein